ncbi:hypothetical protein [Candidatus Harpocratesius sp.]
MKKPTIIQYQITDYIGLFTNVIFNMPLPAERRKGLKALFHQKPPKKRGRHKSCIGRKLIRT